MKDVRRIYLYHHKHYNNTHNICSMNTIQLCVPVNSKCSFDFDTGLVQLHSVSKLTLNRLLN